MKKKWILGILCMLFVMTVFRVDAKAAIKVESLKVTTKSKEGFNPAKDQSVTFKIGTKADVKNSSVRVRVLNSKGKYIYQKTVNNKKAKSSITIQWNGKAIKGNTAKLKTNSYIKDGNYTVEVYASYKKAKKTISAKKTAKLKVSTKTKAPKVPELEQSEALGEDLLQGNNDRLDGGKIPEENKLPSQQKVEEPKSNGYVAIYTGNAEIDYLAELMVQAAGVKPSMTDDEKVKRIYHWMNYNFYHIHHDQPLQTRYYDLSKLKSEVAAYKKKMEREVSQGKAIYSKYTYYNIRQMMQYRCGECNDTSAAFKILCNHVGVEAGICHGRYINRNGTRVGHYWNYAVIDGTTYYYDIDVQIQNVGKVKDDYYWYKDNREKAEQRHEFLN